MTYHYGRHAHQNRDTLETAFELQEILNKAKFFGSISQNQSLAYSLEEVIEYSKEGGLFPSLPQIIAILSKLGENRFMFGRSVVDLKEYPKWEKWNQNLIPNSEEIVMLDRSKTFSHWREPIYVCIHGGSLITPERIRKWENGKPYEFKQPHSIEFDDDEVSKILSGEMSDGDKVDVFHVDEVIKGKIRSPFRRHVIWMKLGEAREGSRKPFYKGTWGNNKLLMARAGTPNYLQDFLDNYDNEQGNNRENVKIHLPTYWDEKIRKPIGNFVGIRVEVYEPQAAIFAVPIGSTINTKFVGIRKK